MNENFEPDDGGSIKAAAAEAAPQYAWEMALPDYPTVKLIAGSVTAACRAYLDLCELHDTHESIGCTLLGEATPDDVAEAAQSIAAGKAVIAQAKAEREERKKNA